MKKKSVIIILALILINQITILKRNLEMGFTPVLTIMFILGLVCDGILIYIIFVFGHAKRAILQQPLFYAPFIRPLNII